MLFGHEEEVAAVVGIGKGHRPVEPEVRKRDLGRQRRQRSFRGGLASRLSLLERLPVQLRAMTTIGIETRIKNESIARGRRFGLNVSCIRGIPFQSVEIKIASGMIAAVKNQDRRLLA